MNASRGDLWFSSPFDALLAAAQRWPSHVFLRVMPETAAAYGIEARCYTYTEALAEVRRLQEAYTGLGLRSGQRVGLMLQNRPAFFFHWFALNSLNASVVPLSIEWRETELQYVIGHSELAVVVAPAERISDLASAAQLARREVRLAVEDDLQHDSDHAQPVATAGRAVDQGRQLDTECAVLYTSGTTGRPKGCVLNNEYFVQAGQWYATIGGLCKIRPGEERMLTALPTSHMNAMAYSTMCMLLTGGCLIALDRFHPRTWWSTVRESGATVVHYLGVMPAILLSQPANEADKNHTVRFGFGAGVGAAHHRAFEERFGFVLLEAWAMTETWAGAVVIANHEPRKIGTACFGIPTSAVDVSIRDDRRNEVSAGVPGELLVRAAGPNRRFGFFDRYLKDEEATAAAWEGGWFHTGDIVMRDEQGALHFVDRKKNVIRRSGENISAVEVEGVLIQHPLVQAVGVAGVPDPVRGEEVMACVVAGRPITAAESAEVAVSVVEFGLKKLAYYKTPGYVLFCAALPRTPTEKIQRAELKRLAHEALANNRAIDTRTRKSRRAP